MPSLNELIDEFLDTLTGHLALTSYLLAVTDEHAVWRRLKKLPFLLPSPLLCILLSVGLHAIPELEMFQYYICSLGILIVCTLWVQWTWKWGFWQSFAATCMAGIFQVAGATLSVPLPLSFAAAVGLHLGVSIAVSLLLYKLRFGMWFRLLLDNQIPRRMHGPKPAMLTWPIARGNKASPWRLALILFALEAVMEMFLRLAFGIQPRFLTFYYFLVVTMAALITVLMIYLARQFDADWKMQAQQDVIAQQLLYEQDLEMIRREVRTFRHDYKNLLAGLSQQAGAGELEELRHTLSELDAGFDQRIGEKIQASAQIGNLRVPQIRSLLLSKLTAMREKGIDCHLEALYPVVAVAMDIWDFTRCLGILIDNAMEAALDMENPWVEIMLFAQEGQVFLRVSNSYANVIEPEKMWGDGWSTKGAGRGLGLSSYQHILEGYPNTSTDTRWTDGVFVQELTVEGRP